MEEHKKYNGVVLLIASIIIFFIIFNYIPKIIKLFSQPAQNFTVSVGKIVDEEYTKALIIRKENVLTNGEKKIEKDKQEGQKVRKGERIGRYYADNEKKILEEIANIDKEIEKVLAENNQKIESPESTILDKKIEALISEINGINKQEKITKITKEVNEEILKKAKTSGELSKEGNKLKKLIDQKTKLENNLNSNTNIITATDAGNVSYKIDGYEGKLKTDNFDYLTKDVISEVDIKSGNIVSTVENNVKIVDGFKTYLVCVLENKNTKDRKVGDTVGIRIGSHEEIDGEIVYMKKISEEENILVFKVDRLYDVLSQYRKVNISIVWWSQEGLKINNNALVKAQNGLYFAKKDKGGYSEIIPVKVIRKTDEYSLIESYTKADYEKAGIKMDYAPSVVEYDEISISPKIDKEDMEKYSTLSRLKEENDKDKEK